MVIIVHGLFTDHRDRLVVGRFKIVFNVKSSSRQLIMGFFLFSSSLFSMLYAALFAVARVRLRCFSIVLLSCGWVVRVSMRSRWWW